MRAHDGVPQSAGEFVAAFLAPAFAGLRIFARKLDQVGNDRAAVAVVGYPDARLGERGCAFIVPKAGSTIDLAAMQAYLAECKMAKQFWPERVELVADLPRTASGKIQKFKLKEVAEAFGDSK